MSVILVFLLVVFGFSLWWLSQQRLLSKPWTEQGLAVDPSHRGEAAMPTAKIALGIFLAVVGALFALFASAYFMRMEYSDWQAPPVPSVIWANTAILVAASIALEIAARTARDGRIDISRVALAIAGAATLVFLAGQLVAWQQLSLAGHYLEVNPANGFFYLLTGMHGLHIIGGLIALGFTLVALSAQAPISGQLQLRVELCAMYWHFLLFVWLGLLVLLAGWAGDFIAICKQVLT
ncbi:cytochrome c oxidase subunit 3 [Oricola cellulosilytica]|uniref:Cytochrome-c oxidase n=1 Tax=Oricola cellulosilytica TaxID=1429082 RepID=A0A4R0PN81_9HYPH|nr:cytochrome c oxidase subunit 3 [Oricola cellulosilytica]TCD16689.1 cytochrome-c oxidase [Oricola cellulosilytica]